VLVASSQLWGKSELNKDVILLVYFIKLETSSYVNKYKYNIGARGFFPTKGFEDHRTMAGP